MEREDTEGKKTTEEDRRTERNKSKEIERRKRNGRRLVGEKVKDEGKQNCRGKEEGKDQIAGNTKTQPRK